MLATKKGVQISIATIHLATMKKWHSLELMNEQQRGNTTAPNRSTAMRTRLRIDTREETYAKKGTSLHKASPRRPLINKEFACNLVRFHGNRIIG